MELYLHSPIHLHGVALSEVQDVFMVWYPVKHRDNFTLQYRKTRQINIRFCSTFISYTSWKEDKLAFITHKNIKEQNCPSLKCRKNVISTSDILKQHGQYKTYVG